LQIGSHTYLSDPTVDTFVTGGPQGNKFVITVIPTGSVTPNVIVDTNKFQLMGRVFDGPVPTPIPRPKPPVTNPPIVNPPVNLRVTNNPKATGPVSRLATVASPKVSITAVDPLASEASGDSGRFMINLSAPSAKNIKVKYSIEGSAKKGKDYHKFSSSMVIPAGSVFGTIDVWPVDDKVNERTEKVTLKLSNKGIKGYSVQGRAVAHVKILDND
jgi:Calx-beta domain